MHAISGCCISTYFDFSGCMPRSSPHYVRIELVGLGHGSLVDVYYGWLSHYALFEICRRKNSRALKGNVVLSIVS